MKVFITVDMEGVACVTHWEDVVPTGNGYQMARRWATAETNAAIEAALEAGATQIVVADSHNDMRNLLPENLNEGVLLVRGTPRQLVQMEGLDDTFDAAILIGCHATAGASPAILSHTYSRRMIRSVSFNGTELGEMGIAAATAGHFGVPVVMVSGDDAVAAEAAEMLPWAERAVTKWAINSFAATSLTPTASQSKIHSASLRALRRLDQMQPYVMATPVEFVVEFTQPMHAYLASDVPGARALDGRTVSYTGADFLEVLRVWRLMMNANFGEIQI